MTNIELPSIDMYDDISTINNYKLARKLGLKESTVMKIVNYASRDNSRTPVQWSAEKNAGFTTAEKAWFHINPNYTEINVEAAEKDPNSTLNFYRKLIKFRKENEIVIYGSYKEHYKDSDELYVYSRYYEGKDACRMLLQRKACKLQSSRRL